MSTHPQLLFVAGPNGAGKSTFSKELSVRGAIIFDVDKVIARIEAQSPDMPPKETYQAATEEFFKKVNEAVTLKQHFTLETNFRDDNLLDIVAEFKRKGYVTNIYYLTLNSIEQSESRVNQRVKNGGHFVDQKNIRKNYDMGLAYLEKYANQFDNVEVIDGSGPDWALRSLLSIQNQQVEYINERIPERVQNTIKVIVEKLTPPSPKQQLRRYRGPRNS